MFGGFEVGEAEGLEAVVVEVFEEGGLVREVGVFLDFFVEGVPFSSHLISSLISLILHPHSHLTFFIERITPHRTLLPLLLHHLLPLHPLRTQRPHLPRINLQINIRRQHLRQLQHLHPLFIRQIEPTRISLPRLNQLRLQIRSEEDSRIMIDAVAGQMNGRQPLALQAALSDVDGFFF